MKMAAQGGRPGEGPKLGPMNRRMKAELGQEHFCPAEERFHMGNFSPGGGNHCHRHHQKLSHLGTEISINIFNGTISSQTLVLLLYTIFVFKPQIGTCGLLVVLITPCS